MEGVGPKLNVEDVVELELYGCKEIENGVKGQIDILDVRFGSLWTSIPYEEFKKCGFKFGDNVLVKIFVFIQIQLTMVSLLRMYQFQLLLFI